jgi:hypothetical protein
MYIDPGAGSLVIQVVSATLIATLATLKQVRQSIARFFARKREK